MKTVQPIRDKRKIEQMKNALMKLDYKYYILFVIGINTGLRISDLLELKVKDLKETSHIRIMEQKTKKEKRFFINENLKNIIEPFMDNMDPEAYLFNSQKKNITSLTIKQYQATLKKAETIHEKHKVDMMTAFKRIKHSESSSLLYALSSITHQEIQALIGLDVQSVLEKISPEGKALVIPFIEKYQVKGKLFKKRYEDQKPVERVQAYRVLNEAAALCGLEEVGTHTLRKTFGYWHYQQYKDVAILQYIFNHSSPSVTKRYIGINQDDMDETIREFSL